MDINAIITQFEKKIDEIMQVYLNLPDEYFFTEKELHSYFYHLCLEDDSFILNNRFNLIHTEYPTPFKCSINEKAPYFQIEDVKSKSMRSHIDLVLLNPNFIDWIESKGLSFDYVNGIRNQMFSDYIKDFINIYNEFYKCTNESILLYALEFKYFRHSYSGIKYPTISIIQDIEKLKKLQFFQFNFMNNSLPFAHKTLSLVFVGDKNQKLINISDAYLEQNNNEYKIISKKTINPIFKA